MGNPVVLDSHDFEQAVRNLEHTLATFNQSVNKLVQAMGMQAENQRLTYLGGEPHYTSGNFFNL